MSIRPRALCAVLLLLSACAEKGPGAILSSGARYAGTKDVADDYRLDVGDKIKVTVFNEPSLSGEFSVGADGTIALPLIGGVPAKGRSVGAFADDARARLADGYLRQPRVSAEIIVYRPFYILGEVDTPGPYPYTVGLTAMNAIAVAKGFTPRANRDVVRIRHQGDSGEVNYRLTPDLHIFPGDTIRVGERYF